MARIVVPLKEANVTRARQQWSRLWADHREPVDLPDDEQYVETLLFEDRDGSKTWLILAVGAKGDGDPNAARWFCVRYSDPHTIGSRSRLSDAPIYGPVSLSRLPFSRPWLFSDRKDARAESAPGAAADRRRTPRIFPALTAATVERARERWGRVRQEHLRFPTELPHEEQYVESVMGTDGGHQAWLAFGVGPNGDEDPNDTGWFWVRHAVGDGPPEHQETAIYGPVRF
jgi:hypothetical protein